MMSGFLVNFMRILSRIYHKIAYPYFENVRRSCSTSAYSFLSLISQSEGEEAMGRDERSGRIRRIPILFVMKKNCFDVGYNSYYS